MQEASGSAQPPYSAAPPNVGAAAPAGAAPATGDAPLIHGPLNAVTPTQLLKRGAVSKVVRLARRFGEKFALDVFDDDDVVATTVRCWSVAPGASCGC